MSNLKVKSIARTSLIRTLIFTALILLVGAQFDAYNQAQLAVVLILFIGVLSITLLTGISGQLSLGQGALMAVGGSAGGGQIVDYVCANLIRILANHFSPAEALAQGHVSTASRGKLQLEKGSSSALMAAELQSKGHTVDIVPMQSGLGFIKRHEGGWIGASDPRRDGVAMGLN